MDDPEISMREAIKEAYAAALAGEVPIGCVIVHQESGNIIGRGSNRRVRDSDPTAHAEIIALNAGRERGDWRLVDCTLYVTLEPCPMCAGAIVNARIPRLVYGCADSKAGAVDSLYQICSDARLNHQVDVGRGMLAAECAELLKDFFAAQRASEKSRSVNQNPPANRGAPGARKPVQFDNSPREPARAAGSRRGRRRPLRSSRGSPLRAPPVNWQKYGA